MAWKDGSSPLPLAATTLVICCCLLAISYCIAEPAETVVAAETARTKAERSEPGVTDGVGAAPEPPLNTDTDTDTDTDKKSVQPEQSQAPAEAPAEQESDPGEPKPKPPNLYDSDLEDIVPVEPVEPEVDLSV